MPTEIIRYINSGSTDGGDGTTPGVSGSDRAFHTPQSALNWVAATYPNRVTSDVLIRLRVVGRFATVSSALTWPATTGDDTRYIIFEPHENKHTGRYGASFDGIDYNGSNLMGNPAYKVEFRDLVTNYTGTSANFGQINTASAVNGCDVTFLRCIFRRNPAIATQPTDPDGASGDGACLRQTDGSASNTLRVRAISCQFLGPWGRVLWIARQDNSNSRAVAYNCTAIDVFGGFRTLSVATGSRVHLRNNRVERRSGSTLDCYSLAVSPTSATNISDDATSPQTALRSLTGTFVDAGAGDYTPTGADPGIGAGTDLSADAEFAFAYDLNDASRTTWDIGALNAASSGPSAAAKTQYRRHQLLEAI